MSRKGSAVPANPHGQALMGRLSELHPEECECRKCRRMRAAVARRAVPRYGQQATTARQDATPGRRKRN